MIKEKIIYTGTISRAKALETLCENCPMYRCLHRDYNEKNRCTHYNAIRDLPNEEPEKLEAEWIHTEECDEEFPYRCSNCNMPSRSNNHHFCSQCGADMYAIVIRKRSLNNDK